MAEANTVSAARRTVDMVSFFTNGNIPNFIVTYLFRIDILTLKSYIGNNLFKLVSGVRCNYRIFVFNRYLLRNRSV